MFFGLHLVPAAFGDYVLVSTYNGWDKLHNTRNFPIVRRRPHLSPIVSLTWPANANLMWARSKSWGHGTISINHIHYAETTG